MKKIQNQFKTPQKNLLKKQNKKEKQHEFKELDFYPSITESKFNKTIFMNEENIKKMKIKKL